MQNANIDRAVDEAKRFLVCAYNYREAIKQTYDDEWSAEPCKYHVCVPKVAGALRRSSMDLTRALAEMRRP